MFKIIMTSNSLKKCNSFEKGLIVIRLLANKNATIDILNKINAHNPFRTYIKQIDKSKDIRNHSVRKTPPFL
jgi:hypothetical protein